MTITEIIIAVAPYKPMTRETLYKHLWALKIKPIGARQRPQRYPDNTPRRVLKRLGVRATNGHNTRAISL